MSKETQSTIFHNKIAEKYESEYVDNYWKLYSDITFENFKKYLPPKGSLILDAGGGTGFWSRKLAKLGYRIVCTDIAQKMLDVGKKLAKKENVVDKINFKNADIMNMGCFDDNSFDMVISEGDPVGYCGNPKKAIKELSRVVKRNSFIVISIDSFFSRLNKIVSKSNYGQLDMLEKKHETIFSGDIWAGKKDKGFPEHDFTVEELRQLFRENNLEVVEIIGKPIFVNSIPQDQVEKILADKKTYNEILKLELKYNSEPSIVGLSNHIQIVGRKV